MEGRLNIKVFLCWNGLIDTKEVFWTKAVHKLKEAGTETGIQRLWNWFHYI